MSVGGPLSNDATSLFRPWERRVENWNELQDAINQLGSAYGAERFVWRGQAVSTWGVWSSLYRRVASVLDRVPTEQDLASAEARLLRLAREEWRLDGIPAIQLFAQMQHVGVPTRLIDATWNPLIAAWFAVAAGTEHNRQDLDELDARLFAFTVKGRIQLNTYWNANTPRWHSGSRHPRPKEWGTGLGRRVWQPPALHSRIPAQSAVFLLDGVPVEGADHALARIHREDASTWSAEDLRTVTSIPLRIARARPGSDPRAKGHVFTYVISAEAKREIREQLEKRFGYSFATIYADIEGLAEYLRNVPERLVRGSTDTRR